MMGLQWEHLPIFDNHGNKENISGKKRLPVIKHLGKFHHDLTVLPNPGIMVRKGNHPQMASFQVSELL